jgi:hypothetical protein
MTEGSYFYQNLLISGNYMLLAMEMKIYHVLQIGTFHINHCEDFYIIEKAGNDLRLCAVMDGCTMGKESYFAATLAGKILRKIAKEHYYQAFIQPENVTVEITLKAILQALFNELKIIKNQLFLETNELLTTLILLLINEKTGNGMVLVIGDGVVCIDGNITEFEQDNKPDYLGYHLNEDFEEWFARQNQKIWFDNAADISIATDGIFTFQRQNPKNTFSKIDSIDFLLRDKTGDNNAEMLKSKVRILERDFDLKPTDDLGIVRVIKTP